MAARQAAEDSGHREGGEQLPASSPLTAREYCEWCDEATQTEAAWNDEWESFGVRCSGCCAWHRSY